jgi:hypothetical protein
MRKLQIDEVEFSLELEPEDIDPRGNASAWGEPEDTLYLNEILDRLSRGDDAAWCVIMVRARPKDTRLGGFEGIDSLGAVTLGTGWRPGPENERDAWAMANDHGMKDQALEHLNARLQAAVERGDKIRAILADS